MTDHRDRAARLLVVTCLLASAFSAFAATSGPAASPLTVSVVDPNGVPVVGAEVIALHQNNGNPDPNDTQLGRTDNTGTANFGVSGGNALVNGDFYQILAAAQGWLPSIVSQLNSGSAPALTAVTSGGPAFTIVLSPAPASPGVGEIDLGVLNATPNSLVFGQIGLQSGGSAAGYGVAPTDGSGAATVQFYDVAATAAPGTYLASVFDPTLNKSTSVPVGQTISGGSLINNLTVDLAGAAPPVTSVGQSGGGAGLSLSGVVTDTSTAIPIAYIGLNFSGFFQDQYGQSHSDFRGVQTDQNGAFQLYNLIPGATYFTSTIGGCVPATGQCYAGFQDGPVTSVATPAVRPRAASPAGSPGPDDFFYPSTGTVLSLRIELPATPASTGTLAVNITDQTGEPFPQATVGISPDQNSWQTCPNPSTPCTSCSGTGPGVSNPGLKQINLNNVATGYALLAGLPSGNYNLSVFTFYGQTSFNAQTASTSTASSNGFAPQYPGSCASALQQTLQTGTTFYRLTIDTTTSPDMQVYDIYGNPVGPPAASTTVVVNVATGGTGMVSGTVSFPAGGVDLSQNPIVLTLQVNCGGSGGCPARGGFKVFNSPATPQSVSYAIPVSSGFVYQMNIASSYWGAIINGGNQVQADLTRSNAAVVNLQFVPAGRVLGFLRKPDGSVYVSPPNSGTPFISANGHNFGGGGILNADGSFVIGGVQPGAYTLNVQSGGAGSFPYATQQPAPTVSVVADKDSRQDVSLVNAVPLRPLVDVAALPPFSMFPQASCPSNGGSSCPPETWTVMALPAGTAFTTPIVDSVFNGNGSPGSIPAQFPFASASGSSNNCGGGNQLFSSPGFCVEPLPTAGSGASYDFYVTREGGFDSAGYAGGVRPYFVIESSTRGVAVGQNFVNDISVTLSGSTIPVQDVALTPSSSLARVPQATLNGTVAVTNIISQRQFSQLGGNFNNFLSYVPILWVYDASGALRASGLIAPFPPSENPVDAQLNQAVAAGNYAQFQTLVTAAPPAGWGPVGYEIRGLAAGQTYSLVATSPNYPPLKTSVTLGPAGSTTTLDMSFDANAGAAMSGVVNSTNVVAAAIAGAQVTIQSTGFPAATVTTDANGAWSLSGLPSGQYQVLVVAAGYAAGAALVNVPATGTVAVPPFSLLAGNSSISGTVYTNNPICPPGAVCSFGRTSLPGATVLAYDDTLNAQSPGTPLPLYRAVTDSSGSYTLGGLVYTDSLSPIPHSFKIFVDVSGYYVVNQSTPTAASPVTGFDFALKPKPLDVNVYGYVSGANFEFQIVNYKSFSSGSAYVGPSIGFTTATAANVTSSFVQKPDGQGNPEIVLDYPLSALAAGVSYTLELIAQPNDPGAPPVVKQLAFGYPGQPNAVCQSIDSILLGDSSLNAQGANGNWALLDITGSNASGLSLPVGGVIPVASTAVPSMCMSLSSATATPQAVAAIRAADLNIDAFLSGVYAVSLSSVSYVKGVDLTLAYDQAKTDITDAAIFAFDEASQRWRSVPGLQTIDPVRGTITVRSLKSLASVLDLKAAARYQALSTGRGYRPSASGLPDDRGLFAILRPSQVSAGSFAGTELKIFNFPNPFNLQTKTVPLSASVGVCSGASGAVVTDGTVIKYEIPPGVAGQGVIRIYTLSGRLVRELDAGGIAPESCYYTTWDGRNRSGLPVADGVYYGILSVGGTKQKSGTFKLAVIK